MKTSNFKKSGKDPNAVSIARGNPKGYKGKAYKFLAPSWELVKVKDFNVYRERYKREVLSHLNAEEVYKTLGDDAILLCWEDDPKDCHRSIVAEWFEEKLGVNVKEYEPIKDEPLFTF